MFIIPLITALAVIMVAAGLVLAQLGASAPYFMRPPS
jgi:cytochrome c-type biogenesis protein CcmE